MRQVALVLALVVSGCSDLIGTDDSFTRLILYASPRQPTADGNHVAQIGAEVVKPGELPPKDPMCVQVTSHFGTFVGTPTGPVPADASVDGCPGERCVFMSIPPGNPRRNFALYQSASAPNADVLLAQLYVIGAQDACPPATLPPPTTSASLTLQVPDVPLPPPDMSAAVMDMLVGGVD